jgi:hypothetical protein
VSPVSSVDVIRTLRDAWVQAIPTEPNGGNHTALFTAAARRKKAHEATVVVAKMLAHVGMKVLQDDGFLEEVSSGCEIGGTVH